MSIRIYKKNQPPGKHFLNKYAQQIGNIPSASKKASPENRNLLKL